MKQIKIKYVRDIPKLQKIKQGDWIDLYTPYDIPLKRWQYEKIPLGICAELPEGYEAHIIPRSSTFEKYGIIQANSFGLIDESYKGDNDEWHFPVFEMAYEFVVIPRHTRICQFRIVPKMEDVELSIAVSLGNSDRGGFGSTGN